MINGQKAIVDLLQYHDNPEELRQVYRSYEAGNPGGDEQAVVDIHREVYSPHQVTCLQKNFWKNDFLDRIEFEFTSNLNSEASTLYLVYLYQK